MITTLSIIDDAPNTIYKRIRYMIKSNVPQCDILCYSNLEFRRIKYNYTNKKIPWRKIINLIEDKDKSILCGSNIDIPKNIGIKRYESKLFMKRLCENAALKYIKKNRFDPRMIRVALIDKGGKYRDILEKVVMFAGDIRVVTDFPDLYLEQIDILMEKYGASILINSSISESDIVICPDKIENKIRLKKRAVVFTSESVKLPLNGTIYYDYKVSLPKDLINIIPDDLEPEYFLSALYDKYKMHKLGEIIPIYCLSYDKVTSI